MMKVDFNLEGKTAVITGATGVMCSVIAEELAAKGVYTAILGNTPGKAEAFASSLCRNGYRAIGYSVDVLNKEKLKEVKDKIMPQLGHLDILINGAGGNRPEATVSSENSFFDMPKEAIERVFDLNVTGAILTTQVFGTEFVKSKKGCVINIASMASYLPLTNTVAYSGAKAAVANFTQWMAVHFNQNYSTEIRVNAIAPGFLLTNQNRFLLTNPDGSATERGKRVIAKTPMGRYGQPQEMAGAVIWLCSDAASFVNGAVIPIDGGFSAYWGV